MIPATLCSRPVLNPGSEGDLHLFRETAHLQEKLTKPCLTRLWVYSRRKLHRAFSEQASIRLRWNVRLQRWLLDLR
jgi:hypothetical protein